MASIEDRIAQRTAVKRNPLETVPDETKHKAPHENIPNTPLAASTISFILGSLFALGLLTSITDGRYWWTTRPLGFFLAAWAGFHWGEFAVTAGWNLEKCSVDSFLLDNGSMYHIANGTALLEYLVTLYLFPSYKEPSYFTAIGVFMVITGQALRSAAMIHASTNFSHSVAFQKRNEHRLVTDGVYAWFRHPSYAGFYYWALGTQLVLQNPFTFILFSVLLWRFFYYRTRAEEKALIKFFGDAYVQYRARVGTKIPFIP